MQPFHFINLSEGDLQEFKGRLGGLTEKWTNPTMKLDRLIASSPSDMEDFLNLLFSPEIFRNDTHFTPVQITVNVSRFDSIDNILKLFQNLSKPVQLELICGDRLEMVDQFPDMKNQLDELLQKFPILSVPRFSLVHSQIHLDFTAKNPVSKKRTRRPPRKFQNQIKKMFPENYPACIGVEYYGRAVFNTFYQLFLKSRTLIDKQGHQYYNWELTPMEFPLPPSPMKFYDFQREQQNWIEIRLGDYFEHPSFLNLWDFQDFSYDSVLRNLSAFTMIRASFWYESWQDGANYRRATHDHLLFTWRDVEFAFYQQNPDLLAKMKRPENRKDLGVIYFQLTSPIEEEDFRVKILEQLSSVPNSLHIR